MTRMEEFDALSANFMKKMDPLSLATFFEEKPSVLLQLEALQKLTAFAAESHRQTMTPR